MHTPSASYDQNGDIVLRPKERRTVARVEPEEVFEMETPREQKPSFLKQAAVSVLNEGSQEIFASIDDTVVLKNRFGTESKGALATMWRVLQQPVWVPGRKGKPKKYTRGTLFVMDTVRFGATFATIFGALFLTLNYQSFFSIVQASLDPLASANAGNILQDELSDEPIVDVVAEIGNAKTPNDGSLLALLPEVGPPDNRLIIPKLNLNVPISIPDSGPLLREDWKALEEEIQKSLETGVIHYPGTARPGQAGNFFITGHSSYYPWAAGEYKSVFARLHDLNVGDEYWVYYGGDKHRYKITEKKEVSPSNVDVLNQPVDQRKSTLMTCTPVGTALRRLILSAQELNNDTGEPIAVGEHEKRKDTGKIRMEQLPI